MLTEEYFRAIWISQSESGYCDQIDGAEYRRVFTEWLSAGRPGPVTYWIRRRANIDAKGIELPEQDR